MDAKEFRKLYRDKFNELNLWKLLQDIWRDHLIFKWEQSPRDRFLHLPDIQVDILQHGAPDKKKNRATLTFKVRMNKKIPGIRSKILFNKDENKGWAQLSDDDPLQKILSKNSQLKTLYDELPENDLLRRFDYRVSDNDVFNKRFEMAFMDSEDISKLPREEMFKHLGAVMVRGVFIFHLAQPTYISCSTVFDVEFDKWLKLVKQQEDYAIPFNSVKKFITNLTNNVQQFGFDPVPGQRRLIDLETDEEYQLRKRSREQLLNPIRNYLALNNPLDRENLKQLNDFYQILESTYKEWRQTETRRTGWTKQWLEDVYITSHRAGITKRVSKKGTKDSPFKDLAKRAKKGKSIDEWQVALFLNSILEWLGPGENLANADLNMTLKQAHDQIEERFNIPLTGNKCQTCETINPETHTTCYWCHKSI